jgi:hypothetical protein
MCNGVFTGTVLGQSLVTFIGDRRDELTVLQDTFSEVHIANLRHDCALLLTSTHFQIITSKRSGEGGSKVVTKEHSHVFTSAIYELAFDYVDELDDRAHVGITDGNTDHLEFIVTYHPTVKVELLRRRLRPTRSGHRGPGPRRFFADRLGVQVKGFYHQLRLIDGMLLSHSAYAGLYAVRPYYDGIDKVEIRQVE